MDLYDVIGSEGGPQVTRIPSMKQNVLNTVRKDPITSVRAIGVVVGGSQSSVHRALQREGLHPYNLQIVPPQPM
ncbi:hypothetical protein TNCV_3339501 [Trichonephila clavipes]|nr:hypothetical protein TNCV_3339501 [Trichonephila clavipes]